ncbi:MAG: DUF3267 domain-containing protein [Candidatus Odinarchaeota archaeon]
MSGTKEMDQENWHVMGNITGRDLLPEIMFWSFIEGIIAFILVQLVLFFKTGSFLTGISISGTGYPVDFLIITLTALFFLTSIFVFHEILHALVARSFGISSKFGSGRIGSVFYFAVEPRSSINRSQFFWITITPTLIVNVFLIILLWLVDDLNFQLFLVMVTIIHFIGCGGDLALITNVFQYPPSVVFRDGGLDLEILSPETLSKRKLFLENYSFTRPLTVLGSIVVYLFKGILITFLISIELAAFLTLSRVSNWNLLISIQSLSPGYSITTITDHFLLVSVVTGMLLLIIRKWTTRKESETLSS